MSSPSELLGGDVIIDGVAVDPGIASISVLDIGLLRGYGCFEALRAYDGVAFRIEGHLDRLQNSAAALGLSVPPREDLVAWVAEKAAAVGDGGVRVVVTGGLDPSQPGVQSRTIVFGEALPGLPPAFRLLPVVAPWHSAGTTYKLTGVKSTSYAPNLAATREAQQAGYDDALLVGRGGEVLEGPTYSIGWVRDGVVVTPTLELGILASITRQAALEAAEVLALDVTEVVAPLGEALAANEVFVMSTIREIAPVTAVGDQTFVPGPVTARLSRAFDEMVAVETRRP